ncbi:glycosyltransferase [Pseudoclavibacter helvolus]|uniref:glycosyltransferase n=1 Tax=Pseudoclavibacter helvolus TaxID=255205 RepID=UPI003C7734D4
MTEHADRARIVVHIAESYAGGVMSAIHDYRRNAPEVSHHLLYATRQDAPLDASSLQGFESVTKFPPGHLARIRAVRAMRRRFPTAVLHAHSSYAGVYVRLAVRASSHRPIAYTPHCYAFERRDVSGLVRKVFFGAEAILALNTSVFAACSRRELALSDWPLSRASRYYVPNVPPQDSAAPDASGRTEDGPLTLVGSGRFGAQKDPEFFARAVRSLREQGRELRALWIGGGDKPELQAAMSDADVEVTGWLPREEVLRRMLSADVYLHSASWEGFPVGVLEVAALRVPTIVRDITAFQGVSVPLMITQPNEILTIWDRLSDSEYRERVADELDEALADCTDTHQQIALQRVYSTATR